MCYSAVALFNLHMSSVELWLYLDVLRRSKAHTRAFAVVAGPLGALCPMPAERLRLALEHAEHANRTADVAAVSRAILLKYSPDDWLVAEKYIAAVRLLSGGGDGDAGAAAASAADSVSREASSDCVELLKSLVRCHPCVFESVGELKPTIECGLRC